jgi:hypothetical protein
MGGAKGGHMQSGGGMGTSRIASRSAFFSSIFRILKASSRDILTFMALALTAALCLASASPQCAISVGGYCGAKQGTSDRDARVSRGWRDALIIACLYASTTARPTMGPATTATRAKAWSNGGNCTCEHSVSRAPGGGKRGACSRTWKHVSTPSSQKNGQARGLPTAANEHTCVCARGQGGRARGAVPRGKMQERAVQRRSRCQAGQSSPAPWRAPRPNRPCCVGIRRECRALHSRLAPAQPVAAVRALRLRGRQRVQEETWGQRSASAAPRPAWRTLSRWRGGGQRRPWLRPSVTGTGLVPWRRRSSSKHFQATPSTAVTALVF